MAPSVVKSMLIAASAASPAAALAALGTQGETLQTMTMHMYKADCGKSRALGKFGVKAAAKAKIPGAGMDPSAIKPFDKVLKDGFYEVECVKDSMFSFGDAHHDNKASYNIGEISNVSIVHYDSMVPKEDREEMTHEVCFDFCRTIPDMGFFGLQNGRMCYCTPYYKAMESDSSQCDAPCDGNPSTMCGGKTKSTIFSMHECQTTPADVEDAAERLGDAKTELSDKEKAVGAAAKAMQDGAAKLQDSFGAAGDPVASELMQSAKVFAGELEEAAGKAQKVLSTIGELETTATGLAGTDFSKPKEARAAEKAIEDMEDATTSAVASAEELEELAKASAPELEAEGAAKLYYPVMYFVDKEFDKMPSTCGGTPSEKPLVGTMDVCAKACSNDVHECVGFSFFPLAGAPQQQQQQQRQQGGRGGRVRQRFLQVADSVEEGPQGICFLFSKMKSTTYYTGCPKPQGDGPDATKAQCMVKFAEFEGTTLKPNPSGKCDLCLKEAKKADRCY